MSVKVVPGMSPLGDTLRGLLDRDIKITRVGPSLAFSAANRSSYLAVYATSAGTPVAAAQSCLRFAAGAATAITMLPVERAAEWIAARRLPDDGFSNLYEVFNVMAALFNDLSPERHVTLSECLPPGRQASPDVAALFQGRAARLDYHVDIKDYCSGRLVILNG